MIGAFITGAAALVTIGILSFGSGSLFQETTKYVMYFPGSVSGLGLGASVKLKGVPIGKITNINIVYNKDNNTFVNQIVFEVQEGSIKAIVRSMHEGSEKKRLITDTNVPKMIEGGLRGKLKVNSFVTGQLVVDCDFYPNKPFELMNFEGDLQEIPTLPSDMEELAKTLDSIDLKSIVNSVKDMITGIDTLVNSPDLIKSVSTLSEALEGYRDLAIHLDRHVAQLSTGATAVMTDAQKLIRAADDRLGPVTEDISGMTTELRRMVTNLDHWIQPVLEDTKVATTAARDTFRQAEAMLGNITYLTDENSTFVYRVDETMVAIRKAAGAVAVLTEYLSRHPEALLTGRQSVVSEEK